jgi:hypothetical protein
MKARSEVRRSRPLLGALERRKIPPVFEGDEPVSTLFSPLQVNPEFGERLPRTWRRRMPERSHVVYGPERTYGAALLYLNEQGPCVPCRIRSEFRKVLKFMNPFVEFDGEPPVVVGP